MYWKTGHISFSYMLRENTVELICFKHKFWKIFQKYFLKFQPSRDPRNYWLKSNSYTCTSNEIPPTYFMRRTSYCTLGHRLNFFPELSPYVYFLHKCVKYLAVINGLLFYSANGKLPVSIYGSSIWSNYVKFPWCFQLNKTQLGQS